MDEATIVQSETMTDEDPKQQQSDGNAKNRRYSSEEVAEIIRISLKDENSQQDSSVDYDDLLAIAAEVGVDGVQVDRAVELLEDEQSAKDKANYLWSRFRTHCILFVGFNLAFVTINVLFSAETFWSMYTIFGWGLFLLGHYAGLRYAPQFVEIAMERSEQLANNKYQQFFEDDGNVAFKSGDYSGLMESQGLISIENDKLVIEYQTFDSMVGFLKTRVKVLEVDFENIAGARMEQKLWSADLVLTGKNMRSLSKVPGANGGKLRLRINRQSRRAAELLVEEIRENLST